MCNTVEREEKKPQINKAVIDIGTNSTRMLIFREDENGEMFRVNKSVRYTRMGQDVNRTGRLHPDAINRNLEALEEYKGIFEDYGVRDVYVFGTSALRDAENSGEFIEAAKERLGMTVEIISGECEAEYGFVGVSHCFDEPILIFDIGGGSTELIYGTGDKPEKMMSLNLGCVRSTESYIKHDPPKEEELAKLNAQAEKQLKKAMGAFSQYKPFRLVGIGGTATTTSTIKQELKIYDSEMVHQSVITKEELVGILKDLSAKTQEERSEIPGLEAKRADIIIAGVCILLNVLKAAEMEEFIVCDYDNLEGAAFSRFMQKKA